MHLETQSTWEVAGILEGVLIMAQDDREMSGQMPIYAPSFSMHGHSFSSLEAALLFTRFRPVHRKTRTLTCPRSRRVDL